MKKLLGILTHLTIVSTASADPPLRDTWDLCSTGQGGTNSGPIGTGASYRLVL
jgi:hypothetical protein